MEDKELQDRLARLRPIDDKFFEKLVEDKEVCQELLRVILNDPKLEVVNVVPQRSIKNLQGRSVRLDALCILGNGKYCNIEIQRADNDEHVKRVRYNASCITANIEKPGQMFRDIPDVIVVYISVFDMFKKGHIIYHVQSTIQETSDVVDNGLTEIYVNTAIKDNSTLSELMDCFEQTNINHPKFPHLSRRVRYFKETQEGAEIMCKEFEEYATKRAQEEVQKEIYKERYDNLMDFFKMGYSPEEAGTFFKKLDKSFILKVYDDFINQK